MAKELSDMLESADVAISRVLGGKHPKSQLVHGPKGSGKTFLLNEIEKIAKNKGCMTRFIQGEKRGDSSANLYSLIRDDFLGMTGQDGKSELVSDGDHFLDHDIPKMFKKIGSIAKEDEKAFVYLINDAHHFKKEELSALLYAIHRSSADSPVLVFMSVPEKFPKTLVKLRNYADRLFTYHKTDIADKTASMEDMQID